jgi:hypothetical protein
MKPRASIIIRFAIGFEFMLAQFIADISGDGNVYAPEGFEYLDWLSNVPSPQNFRVYCELKEWKEGKVVVAEGPMSDWITAHPGRHMHFPLPIPVLKLRRA